MSLMIIQMFPQLLTFVAIFLLLTMLEISWLGIDSKIALIAVYWGGALGANTFLMYGFFNPFRWNSMKRPRSMGRRTPRFIGRSSCRWLYRFSQWWGCCLSSAHLTTSFWRARSSRSGQLDVGCGNEPVGGWQREALGVVQGRVHYLCLADLLLFPFPPEVHRLWSDRRALSRVKEFSSP